MRPLADCISEYAASAPAAAAIISGAIRWSYAELDKASDAFVALLCEREIRPGDRIVYDGRNTHLFFAVLFGAMRAGVVLVPVNRRSSARETSFVIEDCAAKLILCDQDLLGIVEEANVGGAAVIVVDADDDRCLRALLATAAAAPRQQRNLQAAALQLYTSGTAGRPKGVIISAFALGAQRLAEFASGHFDDWRGDEVLFSPLPNFHIGGISWALTAFVRGLPLVITTDSSPAAILNTVLLHGVTRAFMVPILVRGLVAEAQRRKCDLSQLRAIHYGASAMDPQLLDRCIESFSCRFLQYYGMTEAGGSVTILAPRFHDSARPILLKSVGQPLPGFSVAIRGGEDEALPVGVDGEIWISGPSVFEHYWRQPEASAAVHVNGWYRTGDGGRLDADGFLYLTDRISDMIVTGGENVYPAEVEAVMREHDAVADCAVVGLPHPTWGEGVTAAVELRPGTIVDADDLVAYARRSLAGYKIPRRIEFGLVLPRTAAGKVQRGVLRKMFADRDLAAGQAPPAVLLAGQEQD